MMKYYLVSIFSGVYHYNEVYTGLDLTDYLPSKLEADPTWFDNHAITGFMEISSVEYDYLYDKLRMDSVSHRNDKFYPIPGIPDMRTITITDKSKCR